MGPDDVAEAASTRMPVRVFVQSGQAGDVGGAAKATLLLCEALRQENVEVTLFATLPPSDEIRMRLEYLGIAVVSAAIQHGWRASFPHRSMAVQLWWRAIGRKPDLIHVVGMSLEARYLLRLPAVAPVYLWETTEAQAGNKFVDPRLWQFLRGARAILVPSAIIASNVRRTYRYEGRIGILPFWSDDTPRPLEVAHPGERRRLLYFGRMDPDKGFEYLLPAFSKVRESLPDAELTICGGGNPRVVPGLGTPPDGVRVLGRVTSNHLEALIRESHGVVLPSLHEGYPISLLEACARGVPVVATRVGSIPGVFADCQCAILVPPADVPTLTAAMLTLLTESGEQYGRRVAEARNLWEEISSPAAVSRMLRQAYV